VRYFVTFPTGEEVEVDLQLLPTGEIEVSAGGQRIAAEVLVEPAAGSAVAAPLALRVDGQVVDLWMEGSPPDVGVVARGQRFYAKVESDRDRALSAALGQKASAGEGLVTSPMPGRVLKVLVAEGDVVQQGAPVVVVEAMKMENELAAPIDGTVRRVFASAGQTVEGGAKLVEIAP
jgi:biotin carboxyl carrier protein